MSFMVSFGTYKKNHGYKSPDSCPICGSEVPTSDLFCEKCGMRIHNHQGRKYNSKANLRSRYIFYNESDYNNAKDSIYYGNRIVYDKLYWYGDWGYTNGHDHAWRVDLYDDLTQEELEYAVGRIREHCGIFYID